MATQVATRRGTKPAPHRKRATVKAPGPLSDCLCGECHDAVTREQIIAAEMRKPLQAREDDPFPELLGSRTLDCGTRWHRGGVLLSDEAAARCGSPGELNRAETRAEEALLRHVKGGLLSPGGMAPPWARELPGEPLDMPRE